MDKKKRSPKLVTAKVAARSGRPRKAETPLAKWLDSNDVTRDDFAAKVGIATVHLHRLCRGDRRPSLELALKIAAATKGKVPVEFWQSVPRHSADPR